VVFAPRLGESPRIPLLLCPCNGPSTHAQTPSPHLLLATPPTSLRYSERQQDPPVCTSTPTPNWPLRGAPLPHSHRTPGGNPPPVVDCCRVCPRRRAKRGPRSPLATRDLAPWTQEGASEPAGGPRAGPSTAELLADAAGQQRGAGHRVAVRTSSWPRQRLPNSSTKPPYF
jgi:hypothetical protein